MKTKTQLERENEAMRAALARMTAQAGVVNGYRARIQKLDFATEQALLDIAREHAGDHSCNEIDEREWIAIEACLADFDIPNVDAVIAQICFDGDSFNVSKVYVGVKVSS